MKTSVYLIITKGGVTAVRQNKPKLTSNQVAVKLNLDISDKFFDRFVPEATLSIPDYQVLQPEITVEAADTVMERLLDDKPAKEEPKVPF